MSPRITGIWLPSLVFLKIGTVDKLRHMQSEGQAARSWPSAACYDCHSLLAILVIGTHCCSFSLSEASLRHHTSLFLDPQMVLPPCHERSCKYNCFYCQRCLMFRFLCLSFFLLFALGCVSQGLSFFFFNLSFLFFPPAGDQRPHAHLWSLDPHARKKM